MKIYLHGTPNQVSELYKIFQHKSAVAVLHDSSLATLPLDKYDVLIDASLDTHPHTLRSYAGLAQTLVLAGSTLMSLTDMVARLDCPLQCALAGFNNWQTFMERPLWELSFYTAPIRQQQQQQTQTAVTNIGQKFDQIGISYRQVADRVGLVTPRVIAMIINEAYFTLQEGTADKAGIDAALKLGTNYPFGPFEWAERIGTRNIVSLLEAVYNDTHDERYKTCPLLKTEALKTGVL